MSIDLNWMPERVDFPEALERAATLAPGAAAEAFQSLANSRMDFVRAGKLDKAIQRYEARTGRLEGLPVVRLAVLGSSTLGYLKPAIRLGALRRGVLLEIYEGPYGMYRQEIFDAGSGLHAFRPQVTLLALDAHHLAAAEGATAEAALAGMRDCWRHVQRELGSVVLQQAVLPVHPALMGNNEDRLHYSPAAVVAGINSGLRATAETDGVYLLSTDVWAAQDGVNAWFDPVLWYRSKQEVHPRASNEYGDQVGRLLAALQGRSSKCLVLDLDNTVWGGVVGDDGLEGVVLGQGSAAGEAHLALQRYAKRLSERGVVLAVCSKNDEATALAPFEQHSEMVLRKKDIACFVANWQDKASNLRYIATTLNLGLDSLVFADDNPVERALIRRELPMVRVPELPEEPAGYVSCLADAGYFEAVNITAEDRERAELYRTNAARDSLRSSSTDMQSFLEALRMELVWSAFDGVGLKRIVQLLNKTNQFNLMTRRYTEPEVLALMDDEDVVTLQLRLTDAYGDNGVIALLVGRKLGLDLDIETWLMSCRVLGRRVEEATLNVLAGEARRMGCTRLVGTYRPTAKNSMVAQHYSRLGFAREQCMDESSTCWSLSLEAYQDAAVPMSVEEGMEWKIATSIAS